jgi:hypothetical protein
MKTTQDSKILLALCLLAASCGNQDGGRASDPLVLTPGDPESLELAGELALQYVDERKADAPDASPSTLRRVTIDP